ncbi:MAG: PHP domain-containing protein [Candidatus Fimadaptatus sp.]
MTNMIKLDTHVHTSEVSACGRLTAEQMVSLYREAGYAAIVITDHLKIAEIPADAHPYETLERQLRGYIAARDAAGSDMRVLLGAEIRFPGGDEDYLLFGLDEQKYFELMRALPRDLATCRELAGGLGLLIYQAHPFRPGLKPAPEALLDGVEVYNGNPRHDSHNHSAHAFAVRSHLRMLSGSDAHQLSDVARGGILAPEWVRTSAELVHFLRDTHQPHMIEDGQI